MYSIYLPSQFTFPKIGGGYTVNGVSKWSDSMSDPDIVSIDEVIDLVRPNLSGANEI